MIKKVCVDMILLESSWRFKDIKDNIEAVKVKYDGLLLPFLYFQVKSKTRVIHEIRQEVFGFNNIQYWQRERLWEVLNNDLEIEKFRRLK